MAVPASNNFVKNITKRITPVVHFGPHPLSLVISGSKIYW